MHDRNSETKNTTEMKELAKKARESARILTVSEAFSKYPTEEEAHGGLLENMVSADDAFFIRAYHQLTEKGKIAVCNALSYNDSNPEAKQDMLSRYHALPIDKKTAVDRILNEEQG